MQLRFLHDVVAVKDRSGPVPPSANGWRCSRTKFRAAVRRQSCNSRPGTPAPRHPGTPAPRHPGTPAPRHPGTPAPRHPGTPAPRHASGQAVRHARTVTRSRRNTKGSRPRRWARRRANTAAIGAEIGSTRPTRVFDRWGQAIRRYASPRTSPAGSPPGRGRIERPQPPHRVVIQIPGGEGVKRERPRVGPALPFGEAGRQEPVGDRDVGRSRTLAIFPAVPAIRDVVDAAPPIDPSPACHA